MGAERVLAPAELEPVAAVTRIASQHCRDPAFFCRLPSIVAMTRIATRPCSFRTSELLRQGGVHPVLARLFASRGLCDARELSSELGALMAPSGLRHIGAAAVFLADAIAAGKKMVIVADYDCDGATACAVALRGLRAMGATVDFIVPNRFEYGYGLTPEIVELTARESRPTLSSPSTTALPASTACSKRNGAASTSSSPITTCRASACPMRA